MGSVLHGSARTTPRIRAELQASQESTRSLAVCYRLNPKTVAKWRKRPTTADAQMGPKAPKSTVLTPAEEAMAVAFRQKTLLPLDDVLGCLKDTIPNLSRSALHRCLQRHGISRLPVEGTKTQRKRFKTYEIGYVHIDSCELRHADGRLVMFLAIDRVSKFTYVEFRDSAGKMEGAAFLRNVAEAFPCQIHTVLTDNGMAFADLPKNRDGPSRRFLGPHIFDRVCREHGIEHRLTKPYHPWTNGQAERMNRTVKDATIKAFHYDNIDSLKAHVLAFVAAYNFAKHLKALRWKTPYRVICDAWTKDPSIFKINPHHFTPGPYTDQIDDLIAQHGSQFASFITSAMNNPSAPAYEWENNVGLSFTTVMENVIGSKFADELTGNAAANVISDGGKGAADTMMGLGGNDTYRIYNSGDIIVEASTQGTADRVMAAVDYVLGAKACIELLTTNGSTGTSSIDLTGNTFQQTITGNAGANILNDGGKGAADTMQGLGGNDTYRIYNSGDVIIESASQGNADRVASAVDYRLGAGVGIEIMTTNGSTGTSDIDLAGNAFAQQITGNAGDNRLEGREGNDTLSGLGGDDTFVFNTKLGASNIDTITDFNVADDRFLLSDAIFTAVNTGVLLSGYFRNNTTGLAQDSNDHVIYERDTGELYYDANGTGSGGGILFAKIGIGLALTNTDFEVA